jgi:transposase
MITELSPSALIGGLVPALPSSILEPLWVQIAALLPTRSVHHPLGCHHPRIPDQIVFDKLIQVLVFGCGYRRIADHTCSATTLRRRRDEWISAGVAEQLRLAVLAAYERLFGLETEHLAVDGCITKAPCGGSSAAAPGRDVADRLKQALRYDHGPIGTHRGGRPGQGTMVLEEQGTPSREREAGDMPVRSAAAPRGRRIEPGAGVRELERALRAKVLAVAELVGTYER